jgi:hypothetical protein
LRSNEERIVRLKTKLLSHNGSPKSATSTPVSDITMRTESDIDPENAVGKPRQDFCGDP